MAITDQDSGGILFSGEPSIEGRLVSLALPVNVTGGPGDYTVGFQIISSDGHATRSATTFTVAGDVAATTAGDVEPTNETTAAENTTEEDTSGFGNPIVFTLAGSALLGVIAGVIVLIARTVTLSKR